MKVKYYTPMATMAGAMLAAMIALNGLLSRYTTPFFSSLLVHGAGLLTSLVLWRFMNHRGKLVSGAAPLWSYTGGMAGALSVVTANMAVNSPLGLTGSLSIFILGQTVTSLGVDRFGLMESPRRLLTPLDALRIGLILTGSLLVINAGGPS
ncbi:MAG: DMT family transporter [Spirochaetales bacterium]|nr:DMT family transporter [Spirochaetales bacterium]